MTFVQSTDINFFTINCVESSHYNPMVFCLLPKKGANMRKSVRSWKRGVFFVSSALSPSSIVTAFDIGLQNAICKSWPNDESSYRVYLTRAWDEKCKSLASLNKVSEVGNRLRGINLVSRIWVQKVLKTILYRILHWINQQIKRPKVCILLGTTLFARQISSQYVGRRRNIAGTRVDSKFGEQFYQVYPPVIHFTWVLKMFRK